MKTLTKDGEKKISDIAARYELSRESVETLLRAVIQGNATMAQFNIPELGGSGQWMKGGMTMVGDMFNRTLKITVDQLCNELAQLVSTEILFEDVEADSHLQQNTDLGNKPWPAVFGNPTASGSQNNFRYAYFAPVRRLVIETNGNRAIYDTKHHQISGVSQQQHGGSQSYLLTSQDGPLDIASLPLISEPGNLSQETPALQYDVVKSPGWTEHAAASGDEDAIFATIEKLSGLLQKGHITEEEFKTKKAELLARI